MRSFSIDIPVEIKNGAAEIRTRNGVVTLSLTEEDIDDLNDGFSITSLTSQGEEVALYPDQ